jgi:serine/threonine protein kinase/tetratricopeptide (TPR) repeat protein/TolB-like protein
MEETRIYQPEQTVATGTYLGPYEILNLVGTGGTGHVYRARDSRLGREVAIKTLPAEVAGNRDRLDRFEKEARLASSLNHPNIVTIYDIGESSGIPYIAMELVAGKTLREILGQGPMPLHQLVNVALQIADGLAKAHDAGIVHRDLKPENVMVTDDGLAKILDFGIGKHQLTGSISPSAETVQETVELTNPGTIIGTANYMSPEQAAAREADFRSDQFSFGSVLYEMTTGRQAFRRETAVQTMSAIIAESPQPVSIVNRSLPDPLRDIIVRCLEKDPNKRYASTRDLAADLRKLSSLLPAGGAELTRPPRTLMVAKRARLAAAVMLGAGVLIVAYIAAPKLRQFLSRPEIVAPLPSGKNVLVLPFHTKNVEDQEFAAGLTATLTAALTQLTTISSLQVAPASDVSTRHINNAEDARRYLGANLVVTGTTEHQGDTLRVSWNVVDTATSKQLRTDTISVKMSELPAVENRTIEGVLKTLELDVKPINREALTLHDTRVPAAKDSYLRARGYLQEYDKPENIAHAISLFEEARKIDPGYSAAYAGLGEAYWRKYQKTQQTEWIDSAQKACQKALTSNEKLAAAHGCLATVNSGTGHYEEAIKEFQRALESEPTNDEFRRELARTEEKLGKIQDAEKTLQQAITLRPHYWANYNSLGHFYFNQGRYADAAEMFSQVIKLAPDSLYGYSNLGGAYVRLGRYSDAIPMFERSASIRPTATAYSNLATAYFNRRRFLEAANEFEKAAKLDEKNYAIWGNLGDAYYWAPGMRSQAPDAYRKAIALGEEAAKVNPRDAILLSRIAGYYAMNDERQPALGNLKRALEILPNEPSVRLKAALIHNHFKEVDQTLEWLEKAAKAGYSITTIRDLPDFDHLWGYRRFQDLLRSN